MSRKGTLVHDTMLETLESRRLMSLVVDLRAAGAADGDKAVTVTHVGQTIQLEAWGVVTGNNDVITDDRLQILIGSFLSSAGGAVFGDLAVTAHTPPFTGLGTADGKIQDLDGDGDSDVGSNDFSPDYFVARSTTMTPGSEPAPGGTGAQFKLADLTFTVTGFASAGVSGTTELNFRPRPGSLRAVWMEDETPYHSGNNTFAAGTPIVLTVRTATISGSVFLDQDGNGKQKKGPDAVGWLVFDDLDGDGIHDADEASALTDADGNFTLTVAPGTHTIRVVPQDGYQPSRRLPSSYTITLASGDSVAGTLFGQQPIRSNAPSAS